MERTSAVAGCPIMTEVDPVHPLASVTVTKCKPAAKPVPVAVVTPLSHKKLNVPEPPLTATVAVPFDPPKQETAVWDVIDATIGSGLESVTVVEPLHPTLSVIVTV
jgi:hypothetical protein